MADAVQNIRLRRLIAQRGWTQAQTAERVNKEHERITGRRGLYTEESIRQLERGKVTWPIVDYRQALCTVFGVDNEADLGLYCRRAKRRAAAMLATSPSAEDTEENMRRSEFIRMFSALTGGAILAEGGLLAMLVGTDSAVAELSVPRRVGPEHVAEVRAIAQAFSDLGFLGHGIAPEAMAAPMRYAVALLDVHSDRPTRIDLHTAVGKLADVIGWSHFDAGHHAAADRYFQVGLHCASVAAAPWLCANILSDMARKAIHCGHPDDALTLLGVAKVREDRLWTLRRANLYAVQARAFGALGDVRECVRSIHESERLFSEGRDDDHDDPYYADLAAYFCEAELLGDTGYGLYPVALAGHEQRNSADRLRQAVESYPPEYARSRALCLARLALLTLRRGDPDEGVELGSRALAEARHIHSSRMDDEIREIYQATSDSDSYRGHAGVATLRRQAQEQLQITQ
jgi:transcriptional regulator with XRE-family HTH domain